MYVPIHKSYDVIADYFVDRELICIFALVKVMKKILSIINSIWNTIQRGISFLRANNKPLLLSLCWVLFIMFFTYTTLWVELCKVDGDFYNKFYASQCAYISLFVNAGIVIMLLFDNYAARKEFHGLETFVPIVTLILCVFIMGHCDHKISEKLPNYISPLSYEKLSIIVYCIFIMMIYYLKVRSMWENSIKQKKELK